MHHFRKTQIITSNNRYAVFIKHTHTLHFVFDRWLERNELYPRILILLSLASMEEHKKGSERNIMTMLKTISNVFLESC